MRELQLRFPLNWPAAQPRTPRGQRKPAMFGARSGAGRRRLNFTEARFRLLTELLKIGADRALLSSNIELRRDGEPHGGKAAPIDPGVAVWFELDGAPRSMACDAWDRAEDNIAAIAATIGALRGIKRWGASSMSQAFGGFTALPAAGETSARPWWDVLGVKSDASSEDIKRAYRQRACARHPDKPGGSRDAWDELQRALREAVAS